MSVGQDLPSEPKSALGGDDLGAAAEGLFTYLCPRADMICNRSDRDRSGWDFVVDLRMQEGLLDQRLKTSAHVQLKATSSIGTGSVTLRLSSADLLAKDPHPALIAVFRMRPDGTPIRGYMVHLLGEPLERLLRRLRHEEFSGRRSINRQRISFDYRRFGQSFDITPEGLRKAVEDACGPDPAAYASEKLRQLAELGYGDSRIVADAMFKVESEEHLARVVLGIEPLRPVRLRTFDNRFGMPVPYADEMLNVVEEITLSPPSGGGCQVAITGAPLTPAATFQAELVFAPPFDDRIRLAVRHADFSLMFHEREADFETKATFGEGRRSLQDAIMLLRALVNMAAGSAEIVITGDDRRFGPLRLPIARSLTGPYVDDLPSLLSIAEDWQRLLQFAGVHSVAEVSIDDLWDSRLVQLAAELLLRPAPQVHFAFDIDAIGEREWPLTAIYFNSAELAGDGISYAVEVELRRVGADGRTARSTAFKPIEVRPRVLDLDEYMDELAARFDAPIFIHPDNVVEVEASKLVTGEDVG